MPYNNKPTRIAYVHSKRQCTHQRSRDVVLSSPYTAKTSLDRRLSQKKGHSNQYLWRVTPVVRIFESCRCQQGSTSAQLFTMSAAGPWILARENTHLHVLGLVTDNDEDVHALGLAHVRSVLVVVIQVCECNRTLV
jgi:hypothetical protein